MAKGRGRYGERRGGRREGAPGKAYSNRSDLTTSQPVRVAPSKQYGQGVQQQAAQEAMPLTQLPTSFAGKAAQLGGMGGQPVPVTPLGAPTGNPAQPITEGLTGGPGAGPEVLPLTTPDDDLEATLRGLNQAFPSSDLERLIGQLATRPK